MPKTKPARLPKDTTIEQDTAHLHILGAIVIGVGMEIGALEAKLAKQRRIIHQLDEDFKRKWKEVL